MRGRRKQGSRLSVGQHAHAVLPDRLSPPIRSRRVNAQVVDLECFATMHARRTQEGHIAPGFTSRISQWMLPQREKPSTLSTTFFSLKAYALTSKMDSHSSCPFKLTLNLGTGDEEKALVPQPPPDFLALGLDVGVGDLLDLRWREAQLCVDNEAYLSATIAMGSLLEGLLLGVLMHRPEVANRSKSAPKNVTGKVKEFPDWTLSQMIDVAHSVGWIDLDVKRFSHVLREFRNLIHPYQQLALRTNPDADTCGISWLVVTSCRK